MSDNKALIKLVHFPIYWEDLSRLSNEEKAALSIVLFAANEMNYLNRLILMAIHDDTGDKTIDAIRDSQLLFLLRTHSSKVIEFGEFVVSCEKQSSFDDTALRNVLIAATKSYEALKKQEGFYLARNVRHEIASHYSLKAVAKNFRHVDSGADCTLFLHKNFGNCFFQLGDKVVSTGRFRRHFASSNQDKSEDEMLSIWLEWSQKAHTWVRDVSSEVSLMLTSRFAQERSVSEKVHWVPSEMIGEMNEPAIPVFLRTTK